MAETMTSNTRVDRQEPVPGRADRSADVSVDAGAAVLAVDGDSGALDGLAVQLKAGGFLVARAANGKEALAVMEKRIIPVLLTALNMPLVDGIQLARLVRARGNNETFIIMLTSGEAGFDYESGYAAGIDDCLAKRLPDRELRARMSAAISTAGMRRALKQAHATIAEAEHAKLSVTFGKPARAVALPISSPVSFSEALQDVTCQSSYKSKGLGGTPTAPAAVFDPTKKLKVLLVGSDETVRARIKPPLIGAGYDLSAAANADAALASLRREFMPLVLFDHTTLKNTGLSLCAAIREQAWPGYVYLIGLDCDEGVDGNSANLDSGVDDWLNSRVSDSELVARLRQAARIVTLEQSLKSAVEERRWVSMADALTGAHSRRYFTRYLGGELKRARRFGTDVSLLALDIDHFKQVNAEFGRETGDVVLQKFVKRLHKFLPREYDWCARLEGGKFAVVLPQTDLAGAAVVAEKLRKAVEASPLHLNLGVRAITVSIGVSGLSAMPKRDAVTVDSLLAHADRCLHQSKSNGRNCVTVATDPSPASMTVE